MYFIGYDIGSSSVKASLLEAKTNLEVSSAQFPKTEMSMIAHHPGWAEQNPIDWWTALKEVTRTILSETQIPADQIQAIGISYQMHGLVVVDQDLQVLRPSIIWCDSRAVAIGNDAFANLGADYCASHLLNSPGNFTASKLKWVKENEPELYKKVAYFMLPGDYIASKMSGRPTTTYSGLSEGVMYDFKNQSVASKLLAHYGIDEGLIPEIVPTFGLQASLSPSIAKELGLSEGTPITYRAGDQPNNAFSLNVLQPGEVAATGGTSGVVYGISDKLENDDKSRVNAFAHVNHDNDNRRIGVLLCINGTGILNAWTKRSFGDTSYDEMNRLAGEVPIGSEGLAILPFGNGAERVLENQNTGAQISGLQFNTHGKGHIYRAVQEGIACSFKYGADIMESIGIGTKVIKAGRANLFLSDIFRQTLSDLTGATIELYNTDGAQGAARGAGVGVGFYDFNTAFKGLKCLEKTQPKTEHQGRTSEMYDSWKRRLEGLIS